MRLLQSLLDSPFFQFSSIGELLRAVDGVASEEDISEIKRLQAIGLPPIASEKILAAMFGVNPGLIWSFQRRTSRYYRIFKIPKGDGFRVIAAPKVGLKVIQKWLSVQLERIYQPFPHVFGFVAGKSHVDAARVHCDAEWVFSTDIRNFFQTTPQENVADALSGLGFGRDGAVLISRLCCLDAFLAQGSPASPVLSNVCAKTLDSRLVALAERMNCRLTRYADDVVLSGAGLPPTGIENAVIDVFRDLPWELADKKSKLAVLPNRLKVHGLLVHGEKVRLTKGYRNKIRAFRHLAEQGKIADADVARVRGHIGYAEFVGREG